MLKIFHKRFPGQIEARGFIAPLQRLQKPFVFDQQRGQPARRLYAVTVSEGFGNDHNDRALDQCLCGSERFIQDQKAESAVFHQVTGPEPAKTEAAISIIWRIFSARACLTTRK